MKYMLPAEMDTIVIGGGASGMMAAVCAAESGEKVLLLEKNEKTGKKKFRQCRTNNQKDRVNAQRDTPHK